MNEDSEIALRNVIDRESERPLHRCLDLDEPAIHSPRVVMLLKILEQPQLVSLFSQDFADVSRQATIESEALLRMGLPQAPGDRAV